MANSQELIQIEQIDAGLNKLNTTINNTSTNYLRLVKNIADNTVVLKEQAVTFENVSKAQKQTVDNSKQLDSLGKQLAATEAKLKEFEDSRTETLIKNRLAIQNATQATKEKVKAEGLAETSLVKMRLRLKELTTEYDKSGTRTKAAADEINKLSREIGKAEAATNRHQRGVGGYADQLGNLGDKFGGLPGPMGRAASGAAGFGKQLLALALNPIVLVIGAIAGALYGLFKAFTSTDEGATAFAGVLKSVGNVVDILIDRVWSFFKLLGSLVTFDWEGIKKNGSDTFVGIGKAINDATKAGWEYEQQMDRINDMESASLVRSAKLRKEIQELTVASKDRALGSKEQIRLAELAMQKAVELNNIEVGFKKDRTEQDAKNLAAKINDDQLTLESKRAQIEEWLKIDDLQLQSALENNKAFAEFYNLNEVEFQKLQKARSEDVDKETELVTSTRRLQTSLFTFKEQLRTEDTAAAKKKADEEKKKTEETEKEKIKILTDSLKEQEQLILSGGEEKNAINDLLNKQEKDLMADLLKYAEDNDKKELDSNAEKNKKKLEDDKKTAEEEKRLAEETRDKKIEVATAALNALFELGNMRVTKELNDLQVEKDSKLANDKLTTEQRAKIEADYTKKSNELKAKQARNEKIQALFNIAINTAIAVMKATGQTGVLAPFVVPGIISLGVIQAALVAAQPIPKYAKGGKAEKGFGIFGEAGRELMFLRSGEVVQANKATYFEGSKFKGAQIVSNPDTEKMIAAAERSGVSGRGPVVDERLLNEMKLTRLAIQNKPVQIVDRDYKPIGYGNSTHQTIYLNKLTGKS